MYGYLPNVAAMPIPIPRPADPSYAELSEFDRLYVPRPTVTDERLPYLTAALRRIAQATYAEAVEIEKLRSDNYRLADECERLRLRVMELEARRLKQLPVWSSVPFGSVA